MVETYEWPGIGVWKKPQAGKERMPGSSRYGKGLREERREREERRSHAQLTS